AEGRADRCVASGAWRTDAPAEFGGWCSVSDELEALSDSDLTKSLVSLTYAQTKISGVVSRLRRIANTRWSRKEVRVATAADGTELGSVTRTNPRKEWVVEDMSVLMAHLQDAKPDALEDREYIRKGVTDEQ